jgi:electron transport complex protein RnfG
MKDYIKMITVLTAIAAVCGFLLSAVKKGTEQRIIEQILQFKQGPAVKEILASSTNDLLQDRQEVTIGEENYLVFIGKKDSKPWALAIETSATGYGDKIGVMTGFDLQNDKITGIGIITHKETPGLGARATEPTFRNNFKDLSITETIKIKGDNGVIDAISGATITSRAVCAAVEKSIKLFPAIKEKVAGKN